MPEQTQEAVEWALTQKVTNHWGMVVQVTVDTRGLLVDKVREYFNSHGIQYETFSYNDLQPYL